MLCVYVKWLVVENVAKCLHCEIQAAEREGGMLSATLASISNCLHDIMMQQAASRIQRVVQAPINTSMSIKHKTNKLIYTFRNIRLKLRRKQTNYRCRRRTTNFFPTPKIYLVLRKCRIGISQKY